MGARKNPKHVTVCGQRLSYESHAWGYRYEGQFGQVCILLVLTSDHGWCGSARVITKRAPFSSITVYGTNNKSPRAAAASLSARMKRYNIDKELPR